MSVRMIAALMLAGLTSAAPAQDKTVPENFDAVPADAGQPFGGIAISPTRIVLDGPRGGQVTLYNSSAAAVTYRIEGIDLNIDETGAHAPVAEGMIPAWSALPHLRYAPRQVTLQPGQRQAIKIIARPPRDMAAGELRSHLRFSSIPVVAPVDDKPAPTTPEGDRMVAVTVGMDFRITIPVLLRIGETTDTAAIERAAVIAKDATRIANVTVARTGTRSAYGTLRVLAADGTALGTLRGVSVPPPLARRIFTVGLNGTARPTRVTYVEELPGLRDGRVLADRAVD